MASAPLDLGATLGGVRLPFCAMNASGAQGFQSRLNCQHILKFGFLLSDQLAVLKRDQPIALFFCGRGEGLHTRPPGLEGLHGK